MLDPLSHSRIINSRFLPMSEREESDRKRTDKQLWRSKSFLLPLHHGGSQTSSFRPYSFLSLRKWHVPCSVHQELTLDLNSSVNSRVLWLNLINIGIDRLWEIFPIPQLVLEQNGARELQKYTYQTHEQKGQCHFIKVFCSEEIFFFPKHKYMYYFFLIIKVSFEKVQKSMELYKVYGRSWPPM